MKYLPNDKTEPYSYPIAYNHVLHFNSQIDAPEYYSAFADTLIGAGEEDVVSIYFATGGGRDDTMIKIINLLRNCKAHTRGYLISEASSAGSFILLNCDEIFVGDYVDMLVHAGSYGSGGDYASVKAHTEYAWSKTKKLLEETYKYFLTEEEINDVLVNNRQMFLDSEEINRRLEIRQKLMLKDQESVQKQAIKEMEDMFSGGEQIPDWVFNHKLMTKAKLISLFKGEVDIVIDEESKTFELIPVDLPEVA